MSSWIEMARRAEHKAELFAELPKHPFEDALRMKGQAGIYALFEGGLPVYVGRTRNLAGRFRAHVTDSHNSASFALKRTREIHGLSATYKAEGSRQHLVSSSPTRETFLREIEKIRMMEFQFSEITDPIDQYLLELALTLHYELPLDGFDSH
ncbi:GIY-YIG nuclease family protein [Defluviimonas sp. WL0024]|uniref:GIY-YIG nuclease family protein n=1 Tax=Albidovulum salinarum TaxID=2984153 RepID=A0ABT2X105_9RHOB|nr:GIY-YIG nuclease family protein [Defluviimonas sp. WL0024]MCU9847608.1 GIY-YIG nuclease family protein [Defluviimonas sp. WL0024]